MNAVQRYPGRTQGISFSYKGKAWSRFDFTHRKGFLGITIKTIGRLYFHYRTYDEEDPDLNVPDFSGRKVFSESTWGTKIVIVAHQNP